MGLWDQFLSWLQQLKEFLLGFLRSKPTLTLDEEIPVEAAYGKIFSRNDALSVCDWLAKVQDFNPFAYSV